MTLSQRAVEAGLSAFKACRPVERTACQDFGMQQDDIIRQQLEAALSASLAVDGLCLVPVVLTENMAAAMECEFSTEAQWAAVLAAANDGEERSPPPEGKT